MKTFYMTFVDDSSPPENRFLGACIVSGKDAKNAHQNTFLFSCNPGGEALIHDITKMARKIKPKYKNRLLSKEEIDEAFSEERKLQ